MTDSQSLALAIDAMTEPKEEVVYPDVLQYVEIKPYKKHSATVIFLHVSTIHISFAGICSDLALIRDWEIVAMVCNES
jgi:hypothetical protein